MSMTWFIRQGSVSLPKRPSYCEVHNIASTQRRNVFNLKTLRRFQAQWHSWATCKENFSVGIIPLKKQFTNCNTRRNYEYQNLQRGVQPFRKRVRARGNSRAATQRACVRWLFVGRAASSVLSFVSSSSSSGIFSLAPAWIPFGTYWYLNGITRLSPFYYARYCLRPSCVQLIIFSGSFCLFVLDQHCRFHKLRYSPCSISDRVVHVFWLASLSTEVLWQLKLTDLVYSGWSFY